jgi:hypothetical protein
MMNRIIDWPENGNQNRPLQLIKFLRGEYKTFTRPREVKVLEQDV